MKRRVRSLLLPTVLIVASGLLASFATVAIANHEEGHTVLKGGRTTKVIAVSSRKADVDFNDEWSNVNGAKATVVVPEGQRALIATRFTAETVCYLPTIDHCSLRILVDGRAGLPSSGTDFHVDSNYADETELSKKAHALDRTLEVGPGTYTVRVQGRAMENTNLEVDDWHMTVKRIRT